MDIVDLKVKKKKKKTFSYKKLVIFSLVGAVLIGGIFFVLKKGNSWFDPISIVATVAASNLKENDGRTNLLLLGSDSRTSGDIQLNLTDSILLVSIGRVEHDVVLLSLPRDLWVQDSRGVKSKINEVYANNKNYSGDEVGGGEALMRVVEEVLGIPLHYYAVINFELFKETIDTLGETPILKEFIDRKVEAEDRERYQTIFAKHVGAVAAPTAGLHFTPHLLKRLELKGVEISPITLHVGLGTFRQVDVEDLTKHKMDSENYDIPEATVELVNKALDNKKRVVSVGTTTLKTIESSVTANGRLKASSGWTDKFIIPPYEFKIANSLITNFHLPESTLLMTASAFGGYDLIMKAYQEAIKEKYRFFSYGDAMLIL